MGLGWGSIINHHKRSHLTFQSQTDKSICSFMLFLAKPSASLVKLMVCACLVTCPVQLFVTLWTVAKKAPLSMKFPRQEYWSGLPLPSPGDLPDPGIELGSPALQEDSLPTELRGKPSQHLQIFVNWVKRILHFQHGNKWMMLSTQ